MRPRNRSLASGVLRGVVDTDGGSAPTGVTEIFTCDGLGMGKIEQHAASRWVGAHHRGQKGSTAAGDINDGGTLPEVEYGGDVIEERAASVHRA
jgi:hypothetical protein